MSDLIARIEGCAGRLTLNRPMALNALTWDMVLGIETALDSWRDDPNVALIIIDAMGERAFCAGGDIADMYASGQRGDLDYGRRFWRDEYRLNHKMHHYPKSIVTFLQGFTMGGGVGVGCHASHRVVDDSCQIAMPECGIGLIPDVGGTLLLAQAPGHLGEYLGMSADRLDAGDAIYAGFADHYVPEGWDDLKAALVTNGDVGAITKVSQPAPASRLKPWQIDIDPVFSATSLDAIQNAMTGELPAALAHAKKLMSRNSPLAMAAAVATVQAVRRAPDMATALGHEFRFTHRAVELSDFIEGIRAAIIDKDRNPQWQDVSADKVAAMIAPLGVDALQLEEIA